MLLVAREILTLYSDFQVNQVQVRAVKPRQSKENKKADSSRLSAITTLIVAVNIFVGILIAAIRLEYIESFLAHL